MSTAISSEHITVNNPETGMRNFSDMWSLAHTQFGATLSALSKSNPDARLRRQDLAGYFFTQYGVWQDVIEETIDWGLADSSPTDRDGPESFKQVSHKVLGEKTVGALSERLLLGFRDHVEDLDLPCELHDYFDIAEEKNHDGASVVSLYPQTYKGVELHFKARTALSMGRLVMNNVIHPNVRVFSDLLEVKTEDAGSRNLVVMSSTMTHAKVESVDLI